MHVLVKSLVALVALCVTSLPAQADWTYTRDTDTSGLAYAKVSIKDAASYASIYTECTEKLDMGLSLILPATADMIDEHGGQAGQILFVSDIGKKVPATVDYMAGENVLTLVAPDPEEIEQVWRLFRTAREKISVRFMLLPEPQVYEIVFPTDGASAAVTELDAYCR